MKLVLIDDSSEPSAVYIVCEHVENYFEDPPEGTTEAPEDFRDGEDLLEDIQSVFHQVKAVEA